MIRRTLAFIAVCWALGFVWFAISLPQPAGSQPTDAIIVPTGAEGRIPHGVAMLRQDKASQMLVTGVATEVRPEEFAAEFEVEARLMDCCITLGFAALNTRGNAVEAADWVENAEHKSVRLVTSDWHMRRAAFELEKLLPEDVEVTRDAIRSEPSWWMLFLEYHKLIAAWLSHLA